MHLIDGATMNAREPRGKLALGVSKIILPRLQSSEIQLGPASIRFKRHQNTLDHLGGKIGSPSTETHRVFMTVMELAPSQLLWCVQHRAQ